MKKLLKLKPGDKVAVLSPSFAAPGKWPHVHELGMQRMREIFGLESVEFPATRKIGATHAERTKDLINAFEDPEIKAVIRGVSPNRVFVNFRHFPWLNHVKIFPKSAIRRQSHQYIGWQ